MNKLKVELIDEKDSHVKVKIVDKKGRKKYIYMHGYLIGMEAAFQLKKNHDFHNLVIVTGSVGSGKSTLIQGESGVNAHWSGGKLGMENVSWSTEKFIEKTDTADNIGEPLWWDESIQGASGRNMAISALGNKLKMAFVTKRFKKHTYYLAIDEINEYAWKLIKMADAWIHVRKFYTKRGYFDVYTQKKKIQFIYNAFKFFNKTWDSKIIKTVVPDCKGKFSDYTDLFIDEDEYTRTKLEETKQLDTINGVQWKSDKVQGLFYYGKGWTQRKIADKVGVAQGTVNNWTQEYRKIIEQET